MIVYVQVCIIYMRIYYVIMYIITCVYLIFYNAIRRTDLYL